MTSFFYLIIFAFGASLGSFLNVVAIRLFTGEPVVVSRSHCPHCGRILDWFELIPVLSFLALQGTCRTCRIAFSRRYLLVELGLGIFFVFVAYAVFHQALIHPFLRLFDASPAALFLLFFLYAFLGSVLLVVLLVDYDRKVILVSWTRCLALVALVLLAFEIRYEGAGLPAGMGTVLIAVLAAAFFLLLSFATRGRGLGWGDAELVFMLLLFLRFPYGILAVILAFWLGALWSIALLLRGHHTLKSQIPFGPFLIMGFLATLAWGEVLLPYILPWL